LGIPNNVFETNLAHTQSRMNMYIILAIHHFCMALKSGHYNKGI